MTTRTLEEIKASVVGEDGEGIPFDTLLTRAQEATLDSLPSILKDLADLADSEARTSQREVVFKALKEATGLPLKALRADFTRLLPSDEREARGPSDSTATELVDMALAKYELLQSDSGEPFGVPREGPRVILLLRGGKESLRANLARQYFQENERAAPQQALADALGTLDGFAQESDAQPLYQRVAEHEGDLWLDLGDATGRAVQITSDGWSVQPQAPVFFRRTPLTSPLPVPEPGGDLNDLWRFLNVTPEDRPLLLAYLVAAFWPTLHHPLLLLQGEQGTGKTTVLKIIVLLLDPSPVPYRKPPRDSDTWVTAASGSWVVGLDNLSSVNDWLADTLCRAVTGEGDVRRRLYTDNSLAVFSFLRVVAISSIDLGSLPGDLADRALPITLEPIRATARKEDARIWTDFSEAHPRLLATLLDLVASVIRVQPSVELTELPRMTGYAKILATIDHLLDTRGLERYLGAQGRLAADSLTGDPFTVTLMETITTPWEGTSAELLALLNRDEDTKHPKGWPVTARAVTQRLRRMAPVLRKVGWSVTDDAGQNKSNVLRWSVTPATEMTRNQPSPSSPSSLPRPHRNERGEDAPQGEEDDNSPTLAQPSPSSPNAHDPRQESADEHEQTSMARIASIQNRSSQADLSRRASHLASRRANLPHEELREKWKAAYPRCHDVPAFWNDLATTSPVVVTIALEMLATDQAAGDTAPTNAYLAAAREAVAALDPKSPPTPRPAPEGIPL